MGLGSSSSLRLLPEQLWCKELTPGLFAGSAAPGESCPPGRSPGWPGDTLCPPGHASPTAPRGGGSWWHLCPGAAQGEGQGRCLGTGAAQGSAGERWRNRPVDAGLPAPFRSFVISLRDKHSRRRERHGLVLRLQLVLRVGPVGSLLSGWVLLLNKRRSLWTRYLQRLLLRRPRAGPAAAGEPVTPPLTMAELTIAPLFIIYFPSNNDIFRPTALSFFRPIMLSESSSRGRPRRERALAAAGAPWSPPPAGGTLWQRQPLAPERGRDGPGGWGGGCSRRRGDPHEGRGGCGTAAVAFLLV